MSAASDIVSSGRVPEKWAEAADETVTIVKDGYKELDDMGDNTQIQALRFARDEQGEVVLDEDGSPILVALADDNGNAVMENHPLVARANATGLHAYRYEYAGEDGSVVAIYAKGRSPVIKMKAFDTIEEASLWSPREEQ